MKAFSWMSSFLSTVAVAACATTVSTGGAGGGQTGQTATGNGNGGSGGSNQSVGGGGTGGAVHIAWVCDCMYGLIPSNQECALGCSQKCPAPEYCSEADQGFLCGAAPDCHPGDTGCIFQDNHMLHQPVCTFDHGLAPLPIDPNEYWESCSGLGLPKCAQYPDGHWVCCDPHIAPNKPNGCPAP
jgi:hypothetical protein